MTQVLQLLPRILLKQKQRPPSRQVQQPLLLGLRLGLLKNLQQLHTILLRRQRQLGILVLVLQLLILQLGQPSTKRQLDGIQVRLRRQPTIPVSQQ